MALTAAIIITGISIVLLVIYGADAVVGGLNDSDFIDGGTNGKGHKFGYKYQLTKNMQGAITFLTNEKNANTTEDNYKRLQADLIFKF
ncbi:hypothetical protein LCGC14_2590870 [marine sediment metagenome]|uniref:Porin domain-containing protein n=1 Tax=marine sediment metagenome TaxID=412755 RepID=A0A0F9ABM5_9ZZZZ